MNSLSQPAQRQTLANSRLRKHSDYLRAYAAARKRQSANMSWFLAPQSQDALAAGPPALVFHPRRNVLTLDFAQLEGEIVRILEQATSEAARGTKRSAAASGAPVKPAP